MVIASSSAIQAALAIALVSPGSGPPPHFGRTARAVASAPGSLPADTRARVRYVAQVMGTHVGEVLATLSEVTVDSEGRPIRTLEVSATGSTALDHLITIRATLKSTMDARTLTPISSTYEAVRGGRRWSARLGFGDGRVRIDTVTRTRRWRRWRWVEGPPQDPLSWMVPVMAHPMTPPERRSFAVVTLSRYLRMRLRAVRLVTLDTPLGDIPAVDSRATFVRWYPTDQLAHGRPPSRRRGKVTRARVFWERGGLRLPVRIGFRVRGVGAVRLDITERTLQRVPDHAQVLKSSHERRAAEPGR